MSDFVEDFQSRYETPSDAEVKQEMKAAYKRGDVPLFQALVNFWAMLHRSIKGNDAGSGASSA